MIVCPLFQQNPRLSAVHSVCVSPGSRGGLKVIVTCEVPSPLHGCVLGTQVIPDVRDRVLPEPTSITTLVSRQEGSSADTKSIASEFGCSPVKPLRDSTHRPVSPGCPTATPGTSSSTEMASGQRDEDLMVASGSDSVIRLRRVAGFRASWALESVCEVAAPLRAYSGGFSLTTEPWPISRNKTMRHSPRKRNSGKPTT